MNVFFHGTIEAGFDVLKAQVEADMAGEAGDFSLNTIWLIQAVAQS